MKNKIPTFNEFINESRKYSTNEKQRIIELWDELFIELNIIDKKEQKEIVKHFDKIESDDYRGDLVELLSDAMDAANASFNYQKLVDFVNSKIK